jgi:hypothetical protein
MLQFGDAWDPPEAEAVRRWGLCAHQPQPPGRDHPAAAPVPHRIVALPFLRVEAHDSATGGTAAGEFHLIPHDTGFSGEAYPIFGIDLDR